MWDTAIPLEIVNEIIQHLLHVRRTSEKTAESSKPDWHLIEGFMLASSDFRVLALAVWFRTLYLRSAADLQHIQTIFPDIKTSWTRHLHCVQSEPVDYIWDLSGFERLSSLRVDWLLRDDLEINPYSSPEANANKYFINVQSPIKDLDIRGLRRPSPIILRALTTSFKDLVTLKLESLRTWCGLCQTSAKMYFRPPTPPTLTYEGGLGLPARYSHTLCSLQHLEEVIITLADLEPIYPYLPGSLSTDLGKDLWAGECDSCMLVMYDREGFPDFKQVWKAAKRGENPENSNTRAIYTKPPSLKRVQWNFWTFDGTDDTRSYVRDELNDEEELEEEFEEAFLT